MPAFCHRTIMNATVSDLGPSPVELEVRRVRELLESRHYAQALEAGETLALKVPENRDVLYLMALSLRYLNRIPEALAILTRLEQHYPAFSRLYQERGHCHVVLKDAPRAIDAFLRGVNINPALPASWSMLEGLYRMTGNLENAGMAAAHVATLKRLPPEVLQATSLFSDGDLAAAELIIRAFLVNHGNHVEAMRLLGRIALKRDVLDDAELLFEAVLGQAADYQAARHDYALVLLERHKYLQARRELEKLLILEPANRQYRTLHATACVGLGEHERAIVLYRELLADAPDAAGSADLHLSVAHALKTLGRTQAAIDAYRIAAQARPQFGDAYWSLANLKTYRFTDDEIARMQADESMPGIALIDRYHLCFEIGRASCRERVSPYV